MHKALTHLDKAYSSLKIIKNSIHDNMPSETIMCRRGWAQPLVRDQLRSHEVVKDCFRNVLT